MANSSLLDPPRETITPETEIVAAQAEAALEPHQTDEYRLIVRHDLIRHYSGRWWIVVTPDADGISGEDYLNRISAAQEDLNRDRPRWARLTVQLPDGAA